MRKANFSDRKDQHKRSSTVNKSQLCSRSEDPLKYYLGVGNNSELIRRVMRRRPHWQQVENSKQMFVNLRWQQTNKGYKYQNCIDNRVFRQSLNHFEHHQQLSNKEYLFRNVYDYCEHHKINAFQFLPVTFVLNLSESTFEQEQTFFLQFYNKNKPTHADAAELHLRRRRMNPNHIFSHSQKVGGHFSKYQIKPAFVAESTPYLWILKPTFYNRGTGIHVFSKLSEMQELMSQYMHGVTTGGSSTIIKNSPEVVVKKSFRIRQFKENSSFNVIRSNSFVVQKYMQKPMLFNGRKFDIRMWVLVSHEMKVYLFREGYLRTSSYNYTLTGDKIADLNVHLTNNAVQKFNQDYGKYQSGNQLSFEYLRGILKQTQQCYQQFMVRVKEIVKITAMSVRKRLNKQERSYCFQIFGYDFMMDFEGNPWLIEVNTNPCLQESSPILQELLPRMIDDAFELTIDQIFDHRKGGSCFPIRREEDNENLWDLIVDLKKN